MTRTTTILSCGLLFLAMGCSAGDRQAPSELDCAAVESPYEFLPVGFYDATQTGWFQYADGTPGGVPWTLGDVAGTPEVEGDDPTTEVVETSNDNVPFAKPDDPAMRSRCGDTEMMEIEARGHNFWGSGFGNWKLNKPGYEQGPADASAYEGISFWVRSAPNADKSFIFYADDPRTMVLSDPTIERDTNGDGEPESVPAVPGEIATFTECLVPPDSSYGEAACYNGGMNAPSAVTRVPVVNECGNSFHTVVDMTEEWQLVLIPWSKLAQWPCPNRLDGGIDTTRISKFEIKLEQGTNYDFWIDNFAFYRRR